MHYGCSDDDDDDDVTQTQRSATDALERGCYISPGTLWCLPSISELRSIDVKNVQIIIKTLKK